LLGAEFVLVLLDGAKIVATGTLAEQEITRVFVHPSRQGEGLGTIIMQRLEKEAEKRSIDHLELDASLVSISYYAALGYTDAGDREIPLAGGGTLPYKRMIKHLKLGT
jgi:GNAT superfamily N-acetyltransferase